MAIDTLKVVLFISLTAWLSRSWTPGKEIISYSNSQEFDYSPYIDATTGITHLSYCNVTDRSVYYLQISKDGAGTTPSLISTGQLCWNGADIAGGHDGSSVFISYYAIRSKKSWVFDTYFVESKDGGKTWSKPVQVPRNDLNDYPFRMWPKLLVNVRTKRLFLFYDYQGPLGQHTIMMTTKPIDSSVLSLERKVLENAYLDISRPILTEEDTTRTTLQLYWRHVFNGKAYFSYSKNNGLTWQDPQEISDEICGNQRIFKIVNDQRVMPSVLIGVCGKLGENYSVKISYDEGKTWTKNAIELPTSVIKDWTFCNQEHSIGIWMIHYLDKNGSPKIGRIFLEKGTFEELNYPENAKNPFARASIGCVQGKTSLLLEELVGSKWVQKVYYDD